MSIHGTFHIQTTTTYSCKFILAPFEVYVNNFEKPTLSFTTHESLSQGPGSQPFGMSLSRNTVACWRRLEAQMLHTGTLGT
jgi:hypothetical protein